jgi:hypothetical protein
MMEKDSPVSIFSIDHLEEPKWGLRDEDLERLILAEKLRDITSSFSDIGKHTVKRFDSQDRIRIIAFHKNSGLNKESRTFFRSHIREGKQIFYDAALSNKETCVVLVSDPVGIEVLKWSIHVFMHEYAHHFQFAHGGFPYFVYKEKSRTWIPQFAKTFEVGPATGSASIDGLPLPSMHMVIQKSNQSLSNMICEGLLRERSLAFDVYKHYSELAIPTDPIAFLPTRLRSESMRRYYRRHTLREYAEWAATVQLAYPHAPKRSLKVVFSRMKNFTMKLNKKHLDAAQAYDRIFRLCETTDFNSFKNPEKAVAYSRKVFKLLKIQIENW